MTYKEGAAVYPEIRYKTLNAKRAPCRIFGMLNLVVRKETGRF